MKLDGPLQNLVLVQVLGMSITMTPTKRRLRARSKFALIHGKGTTEPRQVHEEQKPVPPLLLLLLHRHHGSGDVVAAPATGFHVLKNLDLWPN